MAKTPTDLTDAGWQKLKGATVGKTGFGEKLKAYEKAKKKMGELPTRSMASFKEAATALAAIPKAIAPAQAKCNKTLHKDTIAALAAYKGLVDKEGIALVKAQQAYSGYLDTWIDKRKSSLKVLTAIKAQIPPLVKAATDAIKLRTMNGKGKEGEAIADKVLKELTSIQKKADESCETWRVPETAERQPHKDDRPDTYFGPLTTTVNEIIAARKNGETEINRLKEAAKVAAAKPDGGKRPLPPKPGTKPK